jgi:DNA-directed RNA polymerase specialized sigma24 family protein
MRQISGRSRSRALGDNGQAEKPRGNRAHEEQLIRRCYTLLLRLLGDVPAAAETALESIERVVLEAETESDGLPSWPRLREAAIERAFVFIRRRDRYNEATLGDTAPGAVVVASDLSEHDALVLSLPLLPRAVFLLLYMEELTDTEIAEMLATDAATVDGLRREAWRALRAHAIAPEASGRRELRQ